VQDYFSIIIVQMFKIPAVWFWSASLFKWWIFVLRFQLGWRLNLKERLNFLPKLNSYTFYE
jgi:hypothetical protein